MLRISLLKTKMIYTDTDKNCHFLEAKIWITQSITKIFILLIIFLIIMQPQKDLQVININLLIIHY